MSDTARRHLEKLISRRHPSDVASALDAYRDEILQDAAPVVLEDDDLTISGRILDVLRNVGVPEGAWDGAIEYIIKGY